MQLAGDTWLSDNESEEDGTSHMHPVVGRKLQDGHKEGLHHKECRREEHYRKRDPSHIPERRCTGWAEHCSLLEDMKVAKRMIPDDSLQRAQHKKLWREGRDRNESTGNSKERDVPTRKKTRAVRAQFLRELDI